MRNDHAHHYLNRNVVVRAKSNRHRPYI